MRNIFLVIKHEVVTMLGKRSFWIMTFLFPALIIVLNVGSQALARSSIESTNQSSLGGHGTGNAAIGYVDKAGLIKRIPEAPKGAPWPAGGIRAFPDEAAAQAALEAGELSEYIIIPADFMRTGNLVAVDSQFSVFGSLDKSTVFEYIVDLNLVGDETLARLVANPTTVVEQKRLAPQAATDKSNPASFLLPFAVLFIFFFVITMSGGFMLQSVSKEKENRTVEILLLSLRPRDLMLGKVLGLGLVALLQMVLWVGAGQLVVSRGGSLLAGVVLPPGFVVWALLYFVLGYLLYASVLGAIGALAPTAREGTQFTFIVMLPLMIPLWLSNVFVQSPNDGAAVFLSLFPLTAPTSMITRLVSGSVPAWQPAVGLVGLVLTTYLFVLLSARFFRADTLLSSASLQWRQIFSKLRK